MICVNFTKSCLCLHSRTHTNTFHQCPICLLTDKKSRQCSATKVNPRSDYATRLKIPQPPPCDYCSNSEAYHNMAADFVSQGNIIDWTALVYSWDLVEYPGTRHNDSLNMLLTTWVCIENNLEMILFSSI